MPTKKVLDFPLSPSTRHEKNKLDFVKALDEFLTEHQANFQLYLEGNKVCLMANINDYQETVKLGSMLGIRKIDHIQLQYLEREIEDNFSRYLELDEHNAKLGKGNK